MDVVDAIRTRRTHKVFGRDPVDRAVLLELLELARWAPNHHLTNPWRFRVLGPQATERLVELADAFKAGSGSKLRRAPTLVAVTAMVDEDPQQAREDLLATGVAAYIVLLAAHDRGLVAYWRTVPVLDTAGARELLGIGDDETPVGLLYLGTPRQDQPPPRREPVEQVVTFLE